MSNTNPTPAATDTLGQLSFVWMDDVDFSDAEGKDKTRQLFDTFRSLVEYVEKAHRRVVAVKSRVGHLRGTLRPEDQQKATATVVGADDTANARRYEFEIARTEFLWAQGEFARSLQIAGCFIRENGLGQDRNDNVKIDEKKEPTEARLFKHNLRQATLLMQSALNAFFRFNTYFTELPEFKLDAEKGFQTARSNYEALMKAATKRALLILPPKD
ncbi:MAG: hypothetical protein WC028_25595 [Candidatus Obscuribacterales bacterium]